MTEDVEKNLADDMQIKPEPVCSVDDSIDSESLSNLQTLQKPDCTKFTGTKWRSFPCRDCDGLVFTTNSLLQLHRVNSHRPHKCQKCCTVFIGRRSFSQHVHTEHPGLPISKVSAITALEMTRTVAFCDLYNLY